MVKPLLPLIQDETERFIGNYGKSRFKAFANMILAGSRSSSEWIVNPSIISLVILGIWQAAASEFVFFPSFVSRGLRPINRPQ